MSDKTPRPEAMTVDDLDLEDLDLWVGPRAAREEAFTILRAQRPRAFFYERDLAGRRKESGYWALTRYADITDVSRRPEDFSSAKGANIVDLPPELTEFMGSIIAMDDPRHARLRRIVARGFTPRTLDTLKSDVEAVAATIVAGIADKGECDFVTEVAALLPLRIIIDLMGIPRSEEKFIVDTTNVLLGATDPEYVPDQTGRGLRTALLQAGQDLAALVRELAEDRLKQPRNDLTTMLVGAGTEEEVLTPQELASFFILLVGAGNETTRNAITHGLLALSEHPNQRAAWQTDFEAIAPAAVEEIVRWASPVLHMRRTVTADSVRLGDQEFAAGDKVVLWYYSANRDEAVFADPFRFDVTRRPNEHIAFGAPGPHFCLGAHLARREITVAFRELFRQLPDIHATGDPEFLRNNFIHGIKHLAAEFTPTGPSSQNGTTS
jgi:cytochrome P450